MYDLELAFIATQEASAAECAREASAGHAKQVSRLRCEVEAGAVQLAARFEARSRAARDDADLRRAQEVHEVEERKNTHIQARSVACTSHPLHVRVANNGCTEVQDG